MAKSQYFSVDALKAAIVAAGMDIGTFVKQCQAQAPANMFPSRTSITLVLNGDTMNPGAKSLGLWATVLDCKVDDFYRKG